MKLKTKFMALMLLMAVVGQSAWANITFNYNSSTSTLTFNSTTGEDDLTSYYVQHATGYFNAKHIVIGGGIKGIADDAFSTEPYNYARWNVESVEFAETSYNTELYVDTYAFNCLKVDNFICNRDFIFRFHKATEDVSTLEFGVFYNSPKKVIIKSHVTYIPSGAFIRGRVSEVDLSKAANLKSIGAYAFAYANNGSDKFQDLRIPANVASIGACAFADYSCEKLLIENSSTPINVAHEAFDAVRSFECYRQITGAHLFALYGDYGNDRLQSVILGANVILGTGYTGSSIFERCLALKSLTLLSNDIFTNNYTTLHNLAVEFDHVETLTLGANVTKVSANAFNGSKTLKTLNVQGSSILDLGANAFADCPNLKNVNGVDNGSANWFAIYEQIGKNFKEFEFGQWICGAKTWTDENNLYTMFPNLEKITFGGWLYTIDDYLYNAPYDYRSSSKLKEIVFEETSGVNVGTYAFGNHVNLTKITGKMLKIGDYAFYACEKLPEVDFTGCKSIGLQAFNSCKALRTLVLPATLESIGDNCFGNNQLLNNAVIYSQPLMIDASLAMKLGGFIENLTVHTPIIGTAFQNTTNLKKVQIGEEVTNIASNAFANATNLKTVIFEGGYLAGMIGWRAYNNLASRFPYVENVSLPDYTKVSGLAFTGSKTLKKVNGKIEPINGYSFANCTNLEEIIISCEKSGGIDVNSFEGCEKLAKVTIESAKYIAKNAFSSAGVKELEISANCAMITSGAFAGCPLTHVVCHNPDPVKCDLDVFTEDLIKQNKATLDVPVEAVAAYRNNNEWKIFYDIFAIGGVKLVDGEPYTNDVEQEVAAVRYTRTFTSTQAGTWQALYVPFDITITDELLKVFDFSKLYMISYKDANNNGEIEDGEPLVMLLMKQTEGKVLHANTPYFIKAKTAGTKSIEVESATLNPAENGTVYCCTTEHEYTLTGINVSTLLQGKYGMTNKGGFAYCSSPTTKLGANRWYMEINSLTGKDDENAAKARQIILMVDGEDDTTGIMDIASGSKTSTAEGVFTLDGRKINETENLSRGIYIKNGKKIMVK